VKGENQMLRAEMKDKIIKQRVVIVAQTIALVAIAILTIMLVREKSYWQGYNEAYNTGQADGWQSCIEENNLYGRY
jgi:hypothetical protein